MTVRELSLRPYPGRVYVCGTKADFNKWHKKILRREAPSLEGRYGRMDANWRERDGGRYVVWAVDKERLCHELSHVVLHVFELVGIDPREANGEPFCYLLSQLLLDSKGLVK